MKKSILNLGKALNKTEQKDIFGGDIALPGDGSGGGSGSGSSCTNFSYCSPGKCFSRTTCKCSYGEGEGSNMNGYCIN